MINETLADAESRMAKSIEALHRDLNTVRTGRASPALLDRVMVEYYGTPTPLNQMSNISAPEARLLVIQPWDKGVIPDIERALQKSDIGITPSNDGTVIRLAIPMLTEDRRKQLVKQVHGQIEDAKVAIRNVRRDSLSSVREMKNEKMISEDDERRAEQRLEELTKRFVDEADKVGKAKEHELLEV
ncbi:MAG: ribosome recycling factor [Thermomicrobiales bacterium]|nr:ribosome recycling factor [Thermomicrobiales bacterium]MCO5222925.1 ribosome recycling factor [Thermomicrobiales bacterium]